MNTDQKTTKQKPMSTRDRTRDRLNERAKELLRHIEIQFNTADYWNNNIRKPNEEKIDADPDGQMKRLAASLADGLCRESTHKNPREQWLADIKRIAIEKYEFTQAGADKTDWQEYAYQFYLEHTPEEAILEDFKNA